MLANMLNLIPFGLGSQSPSRLPLPKVSPCYFPISIGRSLLEAFMPQGNTTSKATCIWPFFGADAFQDVVLSCLQRVQITLSSVVYNSQSTQVFAWGFALMKSTFKVKTRTLSGHLHDA